MRSALFLIVVAACTKPDTGTAPKPSASVSVAPSASTPPPVASASTTGEYRGSYDATAGSLFVPDAGPWEHFKFRGDDAGALGEGSLRLVLEPNGGAVSGDLQGPLGPASLTGMVDGATVTFHLTPEGEDGLRFSGTGMGTLNAGVISGEIHASSWHGNVLRDATFRVQAH